MATLERAITIAAQAHAGQVDKAGLPYILHPLRVMLALSTPEERIVGVLHDVIEDSRWTLQDLRQQGFTAEVVEAVDAVTRRPHESYEQFVLRAVRNPIGRQVKRADLTDNCDRSRIARPTDKDRQRLEKYESALRLIDEYEAGLSAQAVEGTPSRP